MEYLDTKAELKRQVTTLQKYLMQVVEHSEMEVQDHEINERIWRKEKMQLKAQIKILKNGGTIEDMDDDDGNLLENFDVNNSSMAVSHSELESSIINLTSERDSLKETVHMLSAKLGIEPFNDQIKQFEIIKMKNKNVIIVLTNNEILKTYSFKD